MRSATPEAPWHNSTPFPSHLEAHPQQVGRVKRVALMEGALLSIVQHLPPATEVVSVPLTDGIVRTLGMYLSILTGKVTRAERALLATWRLGGLVDVHYGCGGLVPPGCRPPRR